MQHRCYCDNTHTLDKQYIRVSSAFVSGYFVSITKNRLRSDTERRCLQPIRRRRLDSGIRRKPATDKAVVL